MTPGVASVSPPRARRRRDTAAAGRPSPRGGRAAAPRAAWRGRAGRPPPRDARRRGRRADLDRGSPQHDRGRRRTPHRAGLPVQRAGDRNQRARHGARARSRRAGVLGRALQPPAARLDDLGRSDSRPREQRGPRGGRAVGVVSPRPSTYAGVGDRGRAAGRVKMSTAPDSSTASTSACRSSASTASTASTCSRSTCGRPRCPALRRGQLRMQRRRVRGVMADRSFNPRALMDDEPIEFTKAMERSTPSLGPIADAAGGARRRVADERSVRRALP